MKENDDTKIHGLLEAWFSQHGCNLRNKSLKDDIRVLSRLIPDNTPLDKVYYTLVSASNAAGYSEWTKSKLLSLLRRVLRWAIENGIIVEDCVFIGPIKKPKCKTRYLSRYEENKLLDETSGLLPLFLLDTGARLGEAMAVTPESFHHDDETDAVAVTLRRTKVYKETCIPLSNRLREAYNRMRKEWTPGQQIFTMAEVRQLRAAINKVCNNDPFTVAQKGRATIHSLRHTFATRSLERGVDIPVVSYIMGHTNLNETLVYTHIVGNQEIAKRAMCVLW